MTELNQKIDFIKNRHLFGGLTNEKITTVARCIEEESYHSGDAILVEGDPSDKFYLIYRGSVKVTRTVKNGGEEKLATLVAGDYFGEMSLKLRASRRASVTAEKETILFAIPRDNVLDFFTTFPKFKRNLEIAVSSNQLARKLNFDWLFSNEVVYYVSRKHKILLWARLGILLLIVVLAILIFILFISDLEFFATFFIPLTLLIAFLLPWFYIDWANDYYIVTNHRVIWLEKLVGVFDRRKEVPMSAILSVDFDTTFLGRIIDIGTVVMRTYTGQISLSSLGHSEEVAGQISDQWQRVKEREQRMEKEAIKKAVREKLFGVAEEKPNSNSPQTAVPTVSRKETFFSRNFSHFFQQRFEENDVITYRRFWVYLVAQSWKPFMVMITSTIFILIYVFFLMSNINQAISVIVIGFTTALFFGSLFRWIYLYLDWSNDFFQITSDQVVDVDRIPFGSDQRRSAPLENILSVEFDMKGLSRIIFNYGTVNINVGSTTITFNEVEKPALVQQEILQRMNNRVMQIRKKEAEFPREQLAEWLDIYHNITNEDTPDNNTIEGSKDDNIDVY